MHTASIKKIVAIIGAILVIGACAISVVSSLRWRGEYHFGVVTEVSNGSLVIVGPDHISRAVVLVGDVREGRQRIDGRVATGTDVVVIGEEGLDGIIRATVIRVVRPPHSRDQKPRYEQ